MQLSGIGNMLILDKFAYHFLVFKKINSKLLTFCVKVL
ncbi:hypothetical protein SGADD02_00807 [Streptococcus gallolyticus]|uniref:Uncharacterized protein n=1 Tax=Streptococcus gallolyticus TaxID=315405 RepID=A0A139QYH9_9STRE|nr:hypothetical protein SGADD02_00807 [Streptococcus gallolyticus]KXU07588.1 hypothetical protein SGADD03_01213 [Streptococcus gallolyticus]